MGPFTGGVFDKRLDGGRAGAQLDVSRTGIRAETSTGKVYTVDQGDCQLELGGASGRMWFCRTRDREVTLFSEAPGFADALAEIPTLRESVNDLRRHRRAEARRGGLFLLTALCMLAALAGAAYYGLQYAGRAAVGALPKEADEKIGRMAIGSMDLGGPVVQDKVVRGAVEEVVERLAKAAPGHFEYQVRVVDAETLNAFALPGGQIVVYTGLMAAAARPEELAGVLAHEIAHVTERHGIERIAHSLGIAGAVELLLGDLGGLSALAVEMMRTGALTSYGRDQERAADEAGVRTMHKAGLDPVALADMFATLKREQESDGLAVPDALEWLSSHPDLDERIAHVRELSGALGPLEAKPLSLDWADVRERIGAPLSEGNGDGAEGQQAPSGDNTTGAVAGAEPAGDSPKRGEANAK